MQDNGGPTQTHALLSGSPATDKGASFGATVDQHGLARPIDNPSISNASGGNGSDIGAFEDQSNAAPSPTPTPTPSPSPTPTPSPTPIPGAFVVTNPNDSGAGSLRQAILDTNAVDGANTITFDPSDFNTPRTIVLSGSVLTISNNLTIIGPGPSLLTVSGNNAVRVFAISPGFTASISE